MKQKYLFILFVILGFMVKPPVVAFGFSSEEAKKEMVYADAAEQERVYELINSKEFIYYKTFEKEHTHIVKESITKMYGASLLDYAKTGELKLYPLVMNPEHSSEEEANYIAKLVCDESGAFAGNIRFAVVGNEVQGVSGSFSFAPELEQYYPEDVWNRRTECTASCDYADHAERIREILGYDEPASVSDVRYLVLDDMVGDFFCVDTPEGYVLVGVGTLRKNETVPRENYVVTDKELAVLAEQKKAEYENYMAAVSVENEENNASFPKIAIVAVVGVVFLCVLGAVSVGFGKKHKNPQNDKLK